jgi:CheY-like chemotaxis protein
VIILSNSNLESDIEIAKELGADDYCRKPDQVEDLARLLVELHRRWLADKLPMPSLSLPWSGIIAFL